MINLAQLGYKHDEVVALLEKDRTIDIEYELLDRYERKIMDLSHVTGSIRFDSTQEIMGTANMTMKEEGPLGMEAVDLRIRPVFKLLSPRGWLRYPLGIYIMSSPERSNGTSGVYQTCSCYDYSLILREDKIIDRLYIPAGAVYVKEISKVILSAGIKKITVESSDLTVKEDIEFDIGESKLDVVNELLTAINYDPIHFDNNGYAVSSRYIEPANRLAEHAYVADYKSLIKDGGEQLLDLFETPNIFIRYTNKAETEPLRGQFINDNPGSIISTVSRGRNIVDIARIDDVPDQETMNALVKRVAIEKSQIYNSITLPTALMPHHSYRDCIYVGNEELGISNRFIEYSWEMNLEVGGTMNHTLKKVIRL